MQILTIERIERKTSSKGQPYAEVHAGDGQVYYAWDRQVIEFLQPGGTYEAEVKEAGRFRKLTAVRHVASQNGPQPVQAQEEPQPGPEAEATLTIKVLVAFDREAVEALKALAHDEG